MYIVVTFTIKKKQPRQKPKQLLPAKLKASF